MRRLRFRLKPYLDESLVGFLIRLVEENLHRDPGLILDHAGVEAGHVEGVGKADIDFDALASSTGLAAADLRRLSYVPVAGARKPMFFGQALDLDLISCHRRRACPACLRDAAYHRAIWDIPLVKVCPIHGAMLIDRCLACGRRLLWRAPLTKCFQCGGDIRKAKAMAVPQDQLGGTREIYRLLVVRI